MGGHRHRGRWPTRSGRRRRRGLQALLWVAHTTSLEPCARFLSGPHTDGTAHLLARERRFVSAVNAAATAATGPSRSIAKEPLVKNPEDFCLARRLVENAARAGGKQLSVSNGGLAEIEPLEGIQRHVTAA